MVLAVCALAVVAAAALLGGFLVPDSQERADGETATASSGASDEATAGPSPSESPKPSPSPSKKSAKPKTSKSPSGSSSPSGDAVDPNATYPADGPGEFRTATVAGERIGSTGRLFRYKVKVEENLAQTPNAVSAEVRRVFDDPRGWTAGGKASFQQVTDGGEAHDFTIVVATPGTVDRMCGQGGLETGGEVNCRVGKNVIVNIKRWLLASPYYQHSLSDYHALTVNHEVGHFLGYGHEGCPGPGKPAPAMMQQIKGLDGCKANPWPYDSDGNYLSGPAVP
ncbi:DUF3152 domain-containing protein [Streptomyces daliensis]